MAVIPTQTDYDLVQMKVRNLRVKVDVLNFNFQTVNSLQGYVTDGSISIDATSDIRRTCNLTLAIEKSEKIIDKYNDKIKTSLANEVNKLMENEEIQNKKGIYGYLRKQKRKLPSQV